MAVLGLVLSLVVVVVGAEALVRGASVLALRLGLSPLFVGLTIVAFGTSSPELGASLVATWRGAIGVSVGNVVGSNIFNLAAIVGVASLLCPIRVRLEALRRELFVAIAAALVPLVSLCFAGFLPRFVGVLLLACLGWYLAWAYRSGRMAGAKEQARALAELDGSLVSTPSTQGVWGRLWVHGGLVVAGVALLVLGSRAFVTNAVALARVLGFSELLIGLTVVAAGTSLPELVTSVVAALRHSPDLAVGNVIGSNIFNVFGIMGVCATLRPQRIAPEVLRLEVPTMCILSLALLPIVKSGGVISRREGAGLVLSYGLYLLLLLWRSS